MTKAMDPLAHTEAAELRASATPDQATTPSADTPVVAAEVSALLWGDGAEHSTLLDYVRQHAQTAVDRVLSHDPHSAYLPLRSKSTEVRLFKDATLSAETPLEHQRCDFRGVTRVPGSLDAVLELLASDDERESYWLALNTQRGLLFNSLFSSRRVGDDAAASGGNNSFPRWNQRYMATRLSKQSCLPPVTCCFSEYAAFLDPQSAQRKRSNGDDAPVSNQQPVESQKALRHAFVYRRSMDPQFFQTEELQAKLQKYGEACETLFLQDWLFEISETDESHICKVVLSCSAFLTGPPQLRHEFREFCTNVLLNLRQVLSNQWVDLMASAGVGPTSMLSRRPWSRRAGGAAQPSRCGVCSSGFSLLKKRHICGSCGVMMCSRCVTKSETPRASQRGATLDINSRRVTKECILCSQFGAEGGLSRVSVSIRRHFSGSFHSMSSLTAPTSTTSATSAGQDEVLSSDEEDNNEDVVTVDDVENLDDLSTTTGEKQQEKQQPETEEQVAKRKAARVRSSTEDNTQSWRQPDPELPPVDARASRTGKARCGSLNLPSSTPREGIVLLTDIETLSLTGSFHRLSTSSNTSSTSNLNSRDSVAVDRKTIARRSPPLPGLRRPVRSVSEGLATKSPAHPTTEYNVDDLANFSLRLT